MSSTWSWKPPVEPSPRIGGGLKAETNACGIPASRGRTAARMPASRSSGVVRSCQGCSTAKQATEFGAVVPCSTFRPPITTALRTPGVESRTSRISSVTRSVRASEAPSGSWPLTMK